jgi:ABC-2 type transport system permease protein
MSAVLALACKEGGALLLDARGLAWLLLLSAILSVFGLLLVADAELSLLDNAQAIYDMMSIVTGLGAVLAIVVGSDAVAGERERATLVPLLLAPVSGRTIAAGKIGGQAIACLALYAIAIPYLWAVGSTGENFGSAVAALLIVGTPVILGFGFFSLGLGAALGSLRSALLTAILVFVISASPLLIGPGLEETAIGRLFDKVNPFWAALNTFDAVVVDSEPLYWQSVGIVATLAWLIVSAWYAHHSVRRLVSGDGA